MKSPHHAFQYPWFATTAGKHRKYCDLCAGRARHMHSGARATLYYEHLLRTFKTTTIAIPSIRHWEPPSSRHSSLGAIIFETFATASRICRDIREWEPPSSRYSPLRASTLATLRSTTNIYYEHLKQQRSQFHPFVTGNHHPRNIRQWEPPSSRHSSLKANSNNAARALTDWSFLLGFFVL